MTAARPSLLAVMLLVATAATPSSAGSPSALAEEVELYFELKLLVRDRVFMRRVALDQWAGGRLLMRAEPLPGDLTRLSLLRPIEDPWTFRWYPTLNEVKLGAAMTVEEPRGDPYETLAALLEPSARERHRLWWDDDRIAPTAGAQPPWHDRAERFWAAAHRSEEKDPLPDAPVYPFYILGDTRERFVLTIRRDGSVDADSVDDRMSEPWLPDGWSDWLSGKRAAGYGYWGAERPTWEPGTYQALARAAELLAWSPFADPSTVADEVSAGDLPGAVVRVIEALQPKFARRLTWGDDTPVRFTMQQTGDRLLTITGNSEARTLPGEPKIRYRVWRHLRRNREHDRTLADEVQLYLVHRNERTIKLWIRVGYRPAGPNSGQN